MTQKQYDAMSAKLDRKYTRLENAANDRGDHAEAERLELRHATLVDGLDAAFMRNDLDAAQIVMVAEQLVEEGMIDDDDIHAAFAQ